MLELIQKYAALDRVPVGPATRQCTEELAVLLDADVREVSSGTRCLDWEIPCAWHVRVGRLKDPDGTIIADYDRHPLYLRSCGGSFQGEVDREELLAHVLHDPDHPDQIPFDYRCWYDARQRGQWGFSLPSKVVDDLPKGRYTVDIDVEYRPGALCYIDHELPGDDSDTILLAAHTCHPGQVNDGIANVAVLIELFQWLSLKPRRLTYRLVLGPEYFTAAALLDEARSLDRLLGGFYMDLAGVDTSLAWSRSSTGTSWMDHLVATASLAHTGAVIESGYRGVIGNDEMFYDGPGFHIPVLPICRVVPDEYHSSGDDLAHCLPERLDEMLDLLKAIIDLAESEDRPRVTVPGPICLSRRGITPLTASGQWGTQATQRVMMCLDGRHSTAQIAEASDLPLTEIQRFVENLRVAGAVELEDSTHPVAIGDQGS